MKTYQEWAEFSKGYTKKSVFLTAEDLFSMSPADKDKRLADKITEMFAAEGVQVTRYRHNYDTSVDKDYWGLVFHKTDSEIVDMMEITALIGVNARLTHGLI